MKTSEKRQQILETANRLFEQQGFNGTGVDQLAAESGVTKRTLYKHFGSKEGLISAVLKDHHQTMMKTVDERIVSPNLNAQEKLMACFDYYFEWFASPNFSGCIFIKTLNELGGCSTTLGRIAQEAKESMRAAIVEIAEAGGYENPQDLALELQLLLEGSIVLTQTGMKSKAIEAAKRVAEKLINT